MRSFSLIILLFSIQAWAQNACYAPWGAYVPDGSDVIAYYEARPAPGVSCRSEYRRCQNGYLSGFYSNPSCTEEMGCQTIEFGYLYNGQTITAYRNSVEFGGARCQSEVRYCSNGRLSGSYTNRSCYERP
jgi:hypothetical protein